MSQKSVMFDFDGTLADSMSMVYDIANEILEPMGYGTLTKTEMKEMRDLSAAQVVKKLGIPAYRIPQVGLRAKNIMQKNIDSLQIVEGVPEMLEALRQADIRMGILSSNSLENVTSVLKRNKLDHYFEYIDTGASLFGKSRRIKGSMRKHKIRPEDCTYVGDEDRDVQAAHDVGIDVIAVTWGGNSKKALEKAKAQKIVSTTKALQKELLV